MLFYFCIVVHNGAGHILLLDFFYGLTLIHFTGPLSQVVQIMCGMCDIYEYIYLYIYISANEDFFFLGVEKDTHCMHS